MRLRHTNAAYLRSLLAQIEGVLLPREDPRITAHAHHLFTFRYVPEQWGGRTKAELASALDAEGVPCSTGYAPLYKEGLFGELSLRAPKCAGNLCRTGFAIDYHRLYLPVCEQICRDTLWLPQTLLLGAQTDMDDIATALYKIQAAWR